MAVPLSPVPPSLAGVGAVSAPTVITLARPPAALTQLPPDAMVQGRAVGPGPTPGTTVVETPQGRLTLPVRLPANTPVTLQILGAPAQGQSEALMVRLTPLPTAGRAAAPAAGGVGPGAVSPGRTAAASPTPAPGVGAGRAAPLAGGGAQAVPTPTAPSPGAAAFPSAPLGQGRPQPAVLLRPLAPAFPTGTPAAPSAPAPSPGTSAMPSPGPSAPAAGAPTASPTPGPPAPPLGRPAPVLAEAAGTGRPPPPPAPPPVEPGGRLPVRVAQVQPPPPAPTAAARLPAFTALSHTLGQPGGATGGVMAGVVGGTTAGGQTMIQTGVGTFALGGTSSAPLPPGSTVLLEPAGPPQAAPAPVAGGEAARPVPFPALAETLETLNALSPPQAQAVQTALPQPGPQLGNQMIFMLTALGLGDARSLLGDGAVRTLERAGAQRLVRRLGEEMQAMRGGEEAREARPGGEWRTVQLPMLNQGQLEQISLHLHTHSDQDSRQEGEAAQGGTRFLVEVGFQALGAMQFDGLMKPEALALVVRSREALPADLRHSINGVFTRACETVGVVGTLTFQARTRFVRIDPPAAPRTRLDV